MLTVFPSGNVPTDNLRAHFHCEDISAYGAMARDPCNMQKTRRAHMATTGIEIRREKIHEWCGKPCSYAR